MCNRSVALVVLAMLFVSTSLYARSLPERKGGLTALTAAPAYCAVNHNVGKLGLAVTNYANFGHGYVVSSDLDCYTGLPLSRGEYPRGSGSEHLFAGTLWIGAIKGNDTLVSVGADGWQLGREFNPDVAPGGEIIRKSTISPDPAMRAGAVSEQDYITVCTDTFTSGVPHLADDYIDHRLHIPLPIQVTQRSYAWSKAAEDDFIIFYCTIRNLGPDTLRDMYAGIYVDGDVLGDASDLNGYFDDISGFRKVPLLTDPACPAPTDSIPVAWIADNDGDLSSLSPVKAVTGVALVSLPLWDATVSFNWWKCDSDSTLDYGPYRKATHRVFSTGGSGVPEGDRNKYFLLRGGEIDFDQVYTSYMASQDPTWGMPSSDSLTSAISKGMDTRYLLSFGPATLAPGDTLPFVYAYVGGENLHSVSDNLQNLPDNPDAYMANLNFDDLDANVRSASWLVDNPGVDTDGDGYKGKFLVCEGDTVFVSGDWIPDFAPFTRSCCIGSRGNVNQSVDGLVDLSDLSLMVLYLTSRSGEVVLPCFDEANINALGIVDLSDLAYEITYLTTPPGEFTLPRCP